MLMRLQRRGFTLIELLVVIAIIALLIGILLPALGKARDSARQLKDQSQVRGLGQSMILYSVDNEDWLPLMPMNPVNTLRIRGLQADGVTPITDPNGVFLTGQGSYGVAGLWSTYQLGDAADEVTSTPPPQDADYGWIGGFDGLGNYVDSDTEVDEDFTSVPVMRDYTEGLEALASPAHRFDFYWGEDSGLRNPQVGDRISEAIQKRVFAPGREQQVANYTVSYLYIAGLRTDDPSVLFPPPFFGTETSAADAKGGAWYGWDWAAGDGEGGPGTNEPNAVDLYGFNPETGFAEIDMFGDRGGNYVFTDGHVEFVTENPQRTFFANPNDPAFSEEFRAELSSEGKSITLIDPRRDQLVETID